MTSVLAQSLIRFDKMREEAFLLIGLAQEIHSQMILILNPSAFCLFGEPVGPKTPSAPPMAPLGLICDAT